VAVGVWDGSPHPRPFAESILSEAEGLRVTDVKLRLITYLISTGDSGAVSQRAESQRAESQRTERGKEKCQSLKAK
jgi:hypothetical protein